MLPDDENSKASTCVEKAFEIWEQTKEQKSTQLIFCDLSTPKGDGTFNVYEDIRNKLIEKGVPPEEIAFIHEANTELRKAELFGKVRSGQIRFLLGSTQKMGAGTNVQDRIIALHHLDVPWRPSDIVLDSLFNGAFGQFATGTDLQESTRISHVSALLP